MKHKSLLLLPLLLTAYHSSVLANAQSGAETMYLGISGAFIDATADFRTDPPVSVGIDNTLLGLIAGYQFNDFVAAELRAYGNIEDDDIQGVDVEVEHHYSLIGKLGYPLHQYFKPYVMVGYGKTKGAAEGDSESEADFTYGVGVDISNSRGVSLQLEWQRIVEDNFSVPGVEFEVDTINLNLVYRFSHL